MKPRPASAARIVSLRTMDGLLVAGAVECAFSFLDRTRGLLGRRELAPDSGLWLMPCRSVHTIGMQMRIDVIFLDQHLRVLRLCPDLAPLTVRLGPPATSSVLELAAGRAAMLGLGIGDELIAQLVQIAQRGIHHDEAH